MKKYVALIGAILLVAAGVAFGSGVSGGGGSGSTDAADLSSGTIPAARIGDNSIIGATKFFRTGGTPSETTYFRGDNTWATPAGTGDVVGPASAGDGYFAYFDSTTGKLLKNGQSSVNPAFSTINVTGANALNLGTGSSLAGSARFKNATNNFYFQILGGVSGADIGWILPTAAAGGSDYLLNVDVDGTMGYIAPASLNAGTASALASDPTDCGGGQFATGIAASGNLTCGTPSGSGDMLAATYDANSDNVVDSAIATAVQDNLIVNADINSSAAIDATKIGAGGVTTTEFGYLGDVTSAIQAQFAGKAPLVSPSFTTPTLGVASATTLNTGQGAYELYAMDQNVRTTDNVVFGTVTAEIISPGADNTHMVNASNTDDPSSANEGDCQYNKTSDEWKCYDGSTWVTQGGGGSGDVVGPSSATDNAVALFDGTTGKLIKNSPCTVGTDNAMACTGGYGYVASATQEGFWRGYELSGGGTNYKGWIVPTAITNSTDFRIPDTDPSGSRVLRCGTPAGGISTCSWATAGSFSVTAVGTAATITNSAAVLDFGTTDPSLSITTAGTYLVSAQARITTASATFATPQNVTCYLYRTNNTPAIIANSYGVTLIPIITTTSLELGSVQMGPVRYTTTNTDDALTIYCSDSAAAGAGSVTSTGAWVLAQELF